MSKASSAVNAESVVVRAIACGMAMQRQGMLVEAENLYAGVLRLVPAHFDALHMLGVLRQQQGRPQDALALIGQALAIDEGAADALGNYGAVLRSLGRNVEALRFYDRALECAPNHIDALGNRAECLEALGCRPEALDACSRWLAAATARGLQAQRNAARVRRGNLLIGLMRPSEALAAFDEVIGDAIDNAAAHNGRGMALEALDRFAEAIAEYDRAIALAPHLAEPLVNRGGALAKLNCHAEALASFRSASALAPELAEAHWNEGLVLLATGQFADGWSKYEWRWKKRNFPDRNRTWRKPIWRGEPLQGRTILLHAEQGLGDTLQFVRYAPEVARRGGKVVLEVQSPLKPLLLGMAGVEAVVTPDEPTPRHDLRCPLLSLPLAFATEASSIPADIPYVAAPVERGVAWKQRLPSGEFRVALAWAGNPAHQHDRHRSIALNRLLPLIAAPGVRFVCVQRDVSAADRAVLQGRSNMLDVGPDLHDFADTAAVLAEVDLVISVDSAVAHLAGALGRPLFVLLPFWSDWRWLTERDDSPWYPSARLFRQPAVGDWDTVVARVGEALRRFAAASTPRPENSDP